MSKEEILAIDNYCLENNVAKRARLRELGISRHVFYHYRQKYFPSSSVATISSAGGTFIPINFQDREQVKTTRTSKQKEFEMAKGNDLLIEMRTPGGVELRIQGQINVSMLREIIGVS